MQADEVQWPEVSPALLRKPRGKVTSVGGRYVISWFDSEAGRHYTAWYGESPRIRVKDGYDLDLVKVACNQHARKLIDKNISDNSQRVQS